MRMQLAAAGLDRAARWHAAVHGAALPASALQPLLAPGATLGQGEATSFSRARCVSSDGARRELRGLRSVDREAAKEERETEGITIGQM